MSRILYRKLVRDRIPEIIRQSGKSCTTEILDDAAYLQMLDEKLNEELAEYQQSKSMEELADLLEVIRAVITARSSSMEAVETLRISKAQARGGFSKRVLLVDVEDQECSAQ